LARKTANHAKRKRTDESHKVSLADIPKGSSIVYVSDTDNLLTYQLGPKAFVLSLEDATNSEYFEMAEVKATSNDDIFKRSLETNPKWAITTGVIGILFILLDIVGVWSSVYMTGFVTIGVFMILSYWFGLSLLILKVAKRPLSKGETALVVFALLIGWFTLLIATGEKPQLGIFHYIALYMGTRAMRLN